ncbi:hypothetical protein M427DRAFT_54500 [Gonapodya prolifera JEL478]|uniref:Protein SCAI n=1 Tax=Gonapodya prolifera (strain JEL478) TaxID=1344416 RepID=A0A139ALA7_GONPJ|nr:hypothetical protein M427DRAFT_54500 [Gonapodya prolifera JEL478]|eukprot:KXS17566.1 hypothetical protein M427DRAFT_54500 [Gonapodya prolifera JEL478]
MTDVEVDAGPNEDQGKAQVQPTPSKVAQDFQALVEKSQQMFGGLRDLPPTGGQKQWQPYFQRTFEVYTRLWKFQQTHRQILENREYYGLKRWEIGEIASKIAQLYYHYYLRTSETNYLQESFVFYEAIQMRNYFQNTSDSKTPALMIKKLRYYARYIVVCLLLNRFDRITEMMADLNRTVDEYTKGFKPNDAAEWNTIITEITLLLETDKRLTPSDPTGTPFVAPSRLRVDRARVDKDVPKLKLQEAILAGNYQNQIKFSELTLDMYRMLQSLEREPANSRAQVPGVSYLNNSSAKDGRDATGPSAHSFSNIAKDEGPTEEAGDARAPRNPHKYLLYRPTLSQLMLYIATAFKEINENTAMLIYLSADGAKRTNKSDTTEGYAGGVATASTFRKGEKAENPDLATVSNAICPGDLVPFTRKPLFIIVDSNNSTSFKNFPKVFGQPLVALMSPTELPVSMKDTTQTGSLFSLFLHSPIKAFFFISDIRETSQQTWEAVLALFAIAESTIADLFVKEMGSLDKSFRRFFQDDFLRQFLVRFVLMHGICGAHTAFKDPKHFPTIFPTLPSSLLSAPEISIRVQEIVNALSLQALYSVGLPMTPGASS